MKIHDLKPAAGSQDRRRGASGAASAARAARPPAAARKGQGARGTVKPGFEGGQTPLHRRTPKAKGFNNPFRVEYHVVNLDTLEALRRRQPRSTPTTLRARGLVAKRGLVKVLGRGELTKALTVKAHAFSASARAGDRGRRWHASRSSPRRGATGARRPRATPSPTAGRPRGSDAHR